MDPDDLNTLGKHPDAPAVKDLWKPETDYATNIVTNRNHEDQ